MEKNCFPKRESHFVLSSFSFFFQNSFSYLVGWVRFNLVVKFSFFGDVLLLLDSNF